MVKENKFFALGNFIACTPAIKRMYEKLERRLPTEFTTEYTKQCFLDCPYIEIVDKVENPIISSNMINRRTTTPDYQHIFKEVTGEDWTPQYHTYVDNPEPVRTDSYAVVINGLYRHPDGRPGGLKNKKEVDRQTHEMVRDAYTNNLIFIGSKLDKSENTPWADEVFDECVLGDIRECLSLINGAEMVFTNDTGLAHAAGAMNKKMLIFWKDSNFLRARNPGEHTKYSQKGEWEKDLLSFV